ncbi:MAG: Asp23/Gls24 family envelope stress response protein [Oscillospiraceae bacterium]|jgi:uncharacterized alkaline shock family protein YloU|nr:Asp23/Gls24 family envelope stress response protein [Oscillospiraceae bacterium]MBQ9374167.1 Asp23/Gls24 family envelope stress response protein [Oscillospiraceae bacterium]
MAENKDYITSTLENGTVNINEDVITTIAAAAVKDVEGVVALAGDDLAGFLGRKNSGKGLKVTLGEDSVGIECSLVVLYGHSVVEIARNVQTVIHNAVESMTGLKVSNVDVNVSGITMSKA